MKIGIFTDSHYCDLDLLERDRKPRYAYSAVKRAFDDFKAQGVEIAVCLGDIVHFHNGTQESIRHLKKISELINSYGIPTFHCMGNHDNEVISPEDFAKVTGFGVAPTVAENDEVRLVFLDASYTPEGEPYGRIDVDWTRSLVPEKELRWLDSQLDTPKRTAVFIHQNIDTNVESRHIVSNADEVNRIIAKHSVTHVYQGHYHYGAQNVINGIPYTTLRAICLEEDKNYLITEV